jgi:hypothetical protein
MASRFTNAERQVLTAVEELLWTEWDPIGCGVPRDEYDSYAMQAYGRAKRGEEADQIAKYLTEVEAHAMGLSPHAGDQERNLAVAKRVTEIVKQGAGS